MNDPTAVDETWPRTLPTPADQYRSMADRALELSNAQAANTPIGAQLASAYALRSLATSQLAIAEQLKELTVELAGAGDQLAVTLARWDQQVQR